MSKSGYMDAVQKMYERKTRDYQATANQMALDSAIIAAHTVFGIGPKRAKEFGIELIKTMNEIAELMVTDSKDDKQLVYSKTKIDELLQKICGENFQPWEVRYYLGGRK